MSRTKRRYNHPDSRCFKRIVQKHLEAFYTGKIYLYDHYRELLKEHAEFKAWLEHAVLCFGHCKSCKDSKRDPKERTKKIKEKHFFFMPCLYN